MGGQFGSLHLPLEVRWHFWSRAPLYAGPVSARDMDWAIAMPSHAGDCASVTPDCTVDYSVGDGNCDAINLVSEKCAYDAGKRPALLLWLHIYPVLPPLLLCGAQCVVRTLDVPCACTAVAHPGDCSAECGALGLTDTAACGQAAAACAADGGSVFTIGDGNCDSANMNAACFNDGGTPYKSVSHCDVSDRLGFRSLLL